MESGLRAARSAIVRIDLDTTCTITISEGQQDVLFHHHY